MSSIKPLNTDYWNDTTEEIVSCINDNNMSNADAIDYVRSLIGDIIKEHPNSLHEPTSFTKDIMALTIVDKVLYNSEIHRDLFIAEFLCTMLTKK